MLQEQIYFYIRENTISVAIAAGSVVLFFLLLIAIQVSRMRREVHKICKKIRQYFDVVLAEDVPDAVPEEKETAKEGPIPVYRTSEELKKQQEAQKTAEDAKLLMDVISEVF